VRIWEKEKKQRSVKCAMEQTFVQTVEDARIVVSAHAKLLKIQAELSHQTNKYIIYTNGFDNGEKSN